MSIILVIVITIGGVLALVVKSARASVHEADERKRVLAAERKAESERQEARTQAFLASQAGGWAFVDAVRIGSEDGLIAMNAAGTSFRIATITEQGGELAISAESVMPITAIRSITVDQPLKPRTTTRVDRVPVAVQNKRSTVGRAVVGTMVAGPLGAVVGAVSASHGGTTIEHQEVRRADTTYVKGDPVLVIATSNLTKPTVRLKFEDAKVLNTWSARLWAARGW